MSTIDIINGQLAEAKGKQLPLVICYKPLLGYFIGTKLEEENRNFTRESSEIWDTYADASEAFKLNHWTQSSSCDLFESD